MTVEEIKRIIYFGTQKEKDVLRDYFKKYGNTYEKEVEVHEILVSTLLKLSKKERILLSTIIGYPVFLRIALYPKIRHCFPLLQDGASLILLDDSQNILVQQRMDNGKFGFSGGCQELGEELADVAIRECYEETGLLLDKNKMISVCEVSGLSRKNCYPNGDVVVNNTALYIGYLHDCTGALRKDYESKQVFFKPISFLENLPEEQKHEKDFIQLCKLFLEGENTFLPQPFLDDVSLPLQGTLSFVDYLSSLQSQEALFLAKKMGYQEFLMAFLDERIRDIFPHFVDKSVFVSVKEDSVLLQEVNGQYFLPKYIQSVGESFENILVSSLGVSINDLRFVVRLSGEKMYMEETNSFINAMVYDSIVPLEESASFQYYPISAVLSSLTEEDKKYMDAYLSLRHDEKKLIKETLSN